MSYYGSSGEIGSLVEALQNKVSNAEEIRDDLGNAKYEIDEALEQLASYIDDVETLLNNLTDLPEVDVSINVDLSFDSND